MHNIRGIILMVAAMAGFAIEDMFVKSVSGAIPVGQILLVLGIGGGVIFGAIAKMRGVPLFIRTLWRGPVLLRNIAELVGTTGFITALALIPISTASAIFQATPLAVTLGAALFFGEQVGWRRWTAISVGFFGVLLIVQPGTDGFEPASLFAVQAVVALTVRDLATRRCPPSINTLQLAAYGFGMLAPLGVVMLALGDGPVSMDLRQSAMMGGALIIGPIAYYALIVAVRIGDVAVVTPFRYSRLVFALIIGVVVFAERPDAMMLLGSAIVIGSGIYTFMRERALARRAKTTPPEVNPATPMFPPERAD